MPNPLVNKKKKYFAFARADPLGKNTFAVFVITAPMELCRANALGRAHR